MYNIMYMYIHTMTMTLYVTMSIEHVYTHVYRLYSLLTLWYVSMMNDDSIQNRCDICNYVIIRKVQLHKIDIVLMTSTFWNLTYH